MWVNKLAIVIFMTFVLVVIASLKAGATGTWTDCGGTTLTNYYIDSAAVKCWEFDAADDSPGIFINVPSVLICLDSNTASASIGDARAMIRRCHIGTKPAANPEYQCPAIMDVALDGTAGASGTQNMCERVGVGVYYIDVTVSAGGQSALVSFQGE